MKRIKKTIKKFAKPISIVVIPHNSFPSFRFSFSILTFLFLIAAWSGFTMWSGYIAGRHFDYNVTKMDNKLLRTKMEYFSFKVQNGLAYLEMAKKTDGQMRKILGMGKSAYVDRRSLGGANLSELSDFKKILSENISKENASTLDESVTKMNAMSEKRLSSFAEITWYMTNRHNFSKAIPSFWPTEGRVASRFGYRRSPISLRREFHHGVDIANSPGTKIVSTADGVVRHTGWATGYGLTVLVDHGFGYSTLYAHLSEVLIEENQKVKRGQKLASMGSTGSSTGPHLHYEVWQYSVPKNPMPYIKTKSRLSKNMSIFEKIFSAEKRN
ncbi:MAG: M23 family metallopeptidase [Elusimicrobiales bacterium]|nr:M23 family metallopeptidase [Elusimicrobiales bacterium]